jgi:protein O-GlcNAc transferase
VIQQRDSLAQTFDAAFSLHEAGRLSEAEELYQAVLRPDRNHFDCLHYLGVLRTQQGRLGEALGLLEVALRQNPDCAEVLVHAGSVLHAMKRYREALTCFEKALVLDRDSAEGHYNRGAVLQALGRHQARSKPTKRRSRSSRISRRHGTIWAPRCRR